MTTTLRSRLTTLFSHPLPWALPVFALALIAYGLTLMPGPVGGDAGELQYAGPLLTLTHPTGHPLYVLLGYVWSKVVPIGSVAYRMNALSAVSGALGAAVLTWLVFRLYRNAVLAVAGGLTFAFGATCWGEATLADKYAFNGLFAAWVIGLALLWAGRRDQPDADRLLYSLSLVYGLSLLHHRSMALFGPWLALLVIWHERGQLWRRWKRTLACLGLVFLPALIAYPLLLPWFRDRALSPNPWRPRNLPEWLDWLADRRAVGTMFVLPGLGGQIVRYVQTLLNDYTPVVALGALLGLGWMVRSRPASALFLGLSFLPLALLAANFRDNDRPFTYYLPSFIVVVYAYLDGVAGLWAGIQKWLADRTGWRRGLSVALALIVLALPGYQLAHTYPVRRVMAVYGDPLDIWRQVLKTGDMGQRLAAGLEDLPADAVVIGDWEQITILWYYQKVEGRRPDLTLVYPITELEHYAGTGQELILTRTLPVGEEWHPTSIGALVWLRREPSFELPPSAAPVGVSLVTPEGQPCLELAGYQGGAATVEAGRHVPLILVWRALASMPYDYSISLHILDEGWNLIRARDISAPVLGMYPTSRWVPGEVVQDYHELDVPPDMPPGRYLWTVVVYRQIEGGFENLQATDGSVEIPGGTFEVIPRRGR